MPIEDELLERLKDEEDALVERKPTADKDEIRAAACAFANTVQDPNTGVLFYAHPIRPDKKGQDVTVELLIDPHTVSLENGSAYSTNLDFQIGAFTSDGKLAHLESQTAKADELRPETYQQFLRSGIPARFQLALKPGNYVLHVAVRDNTNGHIGSLEMPLQIEK